MSASDSKPDTLMTREAIVIERAQNGVIVRPHEGWYHRGTGTAFEVDQVKVFNDLKDFERWFSGFFPGGAP